MHVDKKNKRRAGNGKHEKGRGVEVKRKKKKRGRKGGQETQN